MSRTTLKVAAWTAGIIVGLVAAVCVAAALVNLHDRAPSPEAIRWSAAYDARPEVAAEDNAFLFLLGLSAPPAADPLAVGRQRLARLQAGVTQLDSAARLEEPPPDFIGVDSDVARFRALCDDVSRDCVRSARNARSAFEKWSSTHAWLLERYTQLLALGAWRETVPHDLQTPLPSYAGAMHGQRLLLWQASALADSGDAARVRELLASDFRFWRMVLASSDTLITKMIATAALQRHLKWGNVALRSLPSEQQLAAIPAEWHTPLAASELSLRRSLTGEWQFLSGSLDTLAAGFVSSGSIGDKLTAHLFQRQDTLNRYAEYFDELSTTLDAPLLGYASAATAASQLAERTANDAFPPRSLYNLAGVLLLGTAGPADYGIYARRVADLEGQRRAALAAVTLRADGTPPRDMPAALTLSPLRNPYDEQPLRWDAAEEAVVFDGLAPGERGEHRFYY